MAYDEYFDSKEELFLAICEHYLKVLREQHHSAIFSTKQDMILDGENFYENFRRLERGNDRVMLEMVVESTRNSKLRKAMYEHRLKVYDAVVEHLNRQIEKGFIKKDAIRLWPVRKTAPRHDTDKRELLPAYHA